MTRSLLPVVLVAVVVVAGCGDGGDASPPVTTTVETTVETPSPPPPPVPKPAQPQAIVIDVDQGRPRGGIQRPKLEQGAKIVLVIRSDLGEAVHVHGYDVERPMMPPGRPLRIPLTLTIAGRFEVELHHPDALLAVLEVRP